MAVTKREAITEAALALFAERGIEASTTREIARRAETAEGNLYRHFKNKDDLALHIFEQSAKTFHDALVEAAGDEIDPERRLAALVRGIFDFADGNEAAFGFLLTAHRTGVLARRTSQDRPLPMKLFIETLKAGKASGAFRTVQPELTTGWIVAMAHRAVVFLNSRMIAESREEVVSQTVAAALRLVQRKPS